MGEKGRKSFWGERPGLGMFGSALILTGAAGVMVGEYHIRSFVPLAYVLWYVVSIFFLFGGLVAIWRSKHPTRR